MALLVGALLVRVPMIDTLPSGLDPDEASFDRSAADVAEGSAQDPFTTGWVTHPTFQFFVQSWFDKILGRTCEAIRYPSAIVGALAVVTTILLERIG